MDTPPETTATTATAAATPDTTGTAVPDTPETAGQAADRHTAGALPPAGIPPLTGDQLPAPAGTAESLQATPATEAITATVTTGTVHLPEAIREAVPPATEEADTAGAALPAVPPAAVQTAVLPA